MFDFDREFSEGDSKSLLLKSWSKVETFTVKREIVTLKISLRTQRLKDGICFPSLMSKDIFFEVYHRLPRIKSFKSLTKGERPLIL